MVLTAIFTSLTAIGTFISIPIGPVPITAQSFFVILSGILLGPKLGALSQTLYLFLGIIGMPIFSGFTGGLQAIYRPSFGFLIGFVFASYTAGKLIEDFKNITITKILISSIVSTMVIYIFGLPYMYYILNFLTDSHMSIGSVFKFGFILFLPGDILKIIILSIIGRRILGLVEYHK